MTADHLSVDMAGGANLMRCFADFVAARPGLPDVASVQMFWTYGDPGSWDIRVQLSRDSVRDIDRWALALDDPVTTVTEKVSPYTGPYVNHEVTGTVHGHQVTVWAHIHPGGAR